MTLYTSSTVTSGGLSQIKIAINMGTTSSKTHLEWWPNFPIISQTRN